MNAVIKTITGDSKKWEAACVFASVVMTAKETDEWERQRRRKEAEYFGISESSTDLTDWTLDT